METSTIRQAAGKRARSSKGIARENRSATCQFESLESRQLLSAAVHNVHSAELAIPSSLSATAKGPTSVALSWLATGTSESGYYILRSSDGSTFSQIGKVSSYKTKTFTDTTASAHTHYSYEVQAFSGATTSGASSAAGVTTTLVAPGSLAAVAAGTNTVNLTWVDRDSTALGYRILRTDNGRTFSLYATLTDPNANSFSDTNVNSGKTYYYEVQAVAGDNVSPVSSLVSATTALAAPSRLEASVLSSSSVQLNWADNDLSATGYYVLRSADGVKFTTLATLKSATAAGYTDKTVLPQHQYFYEIKAFDAVVTSPASNIASANTPLAIPTSVTATAKSPTSVLVSWSDTDAAATGYYVLRALDGGDFAPVATINSGRTVSFSDTGLSSNKLYRYEVQAFSTLNTSAISNIATATTPLFAPTAFTATAPTPTSVQLNWTDNDPAATGYVILRMTSDGKSFVQLASLTDPNASSYTDLMVGSGKTFKYEIQAVNSTNKSAIVGPVSATTSMIAPSDLHATQVGTSVSLSWIDHDSSATGYYVMRSVDGNTFTQLAKITSGSATSYTDSSAATAHTYFYKVQAVNGITSSPMTSPVSITTAMGAPTSLVATMAGSWVSLSWTNKETAATGFTVLRSENGTDFTTLTTLNSISTTSFVDSNVDAGKTYYYEVQAFNSSLTSGVSNKASITTPAAPVTPDASGITISTRYGNELVITASGTADSILISQSDSTLNIKADGQSFMQSIPTAGVFIYTRGGSDSINLDSSLLVHTTVESIDNATTAIQSTTSNVSAWIDSADSFTGSGVVHAVSAFAGGVSKALGAALANPTDSGTTTKVTGHSLFGTAPIADDINQGSVGDCYFLSSLAAFAQVKPSVVQEAAVDMGDGTYVVRFFNASNAASYVRVSNDFSTGYFNGFKYAHPGADGDIWAMVMEKAFCYFRTGANTYASINSGWMGSVYTNFGVSSNTIFLSSYSSESTFYNLVSNALNSGEAVTFGTTNAPNLVSGHAYTLVRVYTDSNGTHYVVRNPWGVSGDSLENSQGYATLTFAQMKANFYDGAVATS